MFNFNKLNKYQYQKNSGGSYEYNIKPLTIKKIIKKNKHDILEYIKHYDKYETRINNFRYISRKKDHRIISVTCIDTEKQFDIDCTLLDNKFPECGENDYIRHKFQYIDIKTVKLNTYISRNSMYYGGMVYEFGSYKGTILNSKNKLTNESNVDVLIRYGFGVDFIDELLMFGKKIE